MKKSIAIMLLVATSVVAIAVGVGIWYTRPSAPLAILEEARARQRQPLLQVTPPQRAEVVPLPPDYQPLIDELLPLLQDELAKEQRTLSREQRAYVDQAVETLRSELLRSIDDQADRAYVDRRITSLKSELVTSLDRLEEKQVDRRAIIDSITADDLRSAFSVFREELLNQVRSEQPRTTVVMTGDVDEELLFRNLAWEIEQNLDFYASYARDAILSTIDEEDMLALYETHRPRIVADVVKSVPVPTVQPPVSSEELLQALAEEIEANRPFYAAYARDAILETISDEELARYYTHYRPVLLADLYRGIKDEAKEEIADYADIIEQMEANREYYLARDRKALPGVVTEADILPLYAAYRDELAEDLFTLLAEEIETNKEAYADYVRSAIGEGVSEEEVLDILGREVEANKSAYAVRARDAILETIGDDELAAYYLHYRPALVADLAEELPIARAALDREQILDDLYARIEMDKPFYAAYVRDALLETMIGDPEFDRVYEESRAVDTDAVLRALGEEIEKDKAYYAMYVRNALLDTITAEDLVNLYLSHRDALVEVGVELDADQIMAILAGEIESDREAYATWARNAIAETITDEDLIAYYLHYRPELLEDVYQGLKDRFAATASPAVPPSPSSPAIRRTVILQEEEPAPPAVVEEKPAPRVPAPPVLVEEKPVPRVSAPSVVVEEEPAPKVPVPPSVPAKPKTVVRHEMTPAEYETLRQEKRNEALDEVLRKIG